MNFSAIEARLNASCLAHLANCTAVVDGREMPAIFDADYAEAQFVAGNRPVLNVASSDVTTVEDGSSVVISGASVAAHDGNYRVAGDPRHDGAGMALLMLAREG